MNDNEYVTKATVDEALQRVEEDSACAMCELNWMQSAQYRAQLEEAEFERALIRVLSRDKDRERRKTISTLYMVLAFAGGLAAYLLVRG